MILSHKRGFTLVELLVVIAIIGILSGLIIVGMNNSTINARIAKTQVFNTSLRDALLQNIEGIWSLDGSFNDTWNNVTGTAVGSPTAVTTCAINSCYSFNGTTQYVTTPNTSNQYTIGAAPMTAMVWVKGASQTGKTIFANWDVNAAYKEAWRIYTAGTALRVALADTTTQTNQKDYTAPTANAILDNTWHLAGFTWSGGGGTLTLYVDGTAIADASVTKNTNLAVASISANGATAAAPITIACNMNNNAAENFLTGAIDGARLYNAAIPTSQIKEQYYAGLSNLLARGEITKTEYDTRINGSITASK